MSFRHFVRRPTSFCISTRHAPRAKRASTDLAPSKDASQIQPLSSILIANRGEIAMSVLDLQCTNYMG